MDREPEDLRGDARDMLEMWRDAQDMPVDARARVRRRLAAPSVPETRRVATRTWAIAAALAAAIILVWWVSTLGDRSIEAARDPSRDQASDRVQGSAPQTAPAVELAPAELPLLRTVEQTTDAPLIEEAPVRSVPRQRPSTPETPTISPSTLAREKTLIQQAWETLAAGDPAGALRIVDTHAREFPEGVLAPERRAVAIVARCKRGDADAQDRAQAWLATEPRSPLAPRVRDACDVEAK